MSSQKKSRDINKIDAAAGLLFVALGLIFAYQSYTMELGTALRMGPGFFPLFLAGLLILLGGLVVVSAINKSSEAYGQNAWRGLWFILPAPVFFGLTVRGLGFVPSIFFTTLIAAKATSKMSFAAALLLSFAVTAFCTLVFSIALGLPFQRFGPWLAALGLPV
jgi:Tripartite tricarboxylate transporter TctB family